MKIVVTGSRTWRDADAIRTELEQIFAPGDILIVGGQRSRDPVTKEYFGADYFAEQIGRELGFEVEVMPANWVAHGKSAGPIRNRKMLDSAADVVIAFWDGASRGTKDCMDEARRRGIPVVTVRPDGVVVDDRSDYQKGVHHAPTTR